MGGVYSRGVFGREQHINNQGGRAESRRHWGRWIAFATVVVIVALEAFWWWPREVKCVDGWLRVAVCQYDSRPGKYRWNAEHALRYAREAAKHDAGVIILPEYSFCTVAEAMSGVAFREMRHLMQELGPRLRRFCRRHRCYLFVNYPHEHPRKGGGTPLRRNRTLVYSPSGCVAGIYDKRIVAAIDEIGSVQGGEAAPPLELEFGKVGLMVCKDSTEPETFEDYDEADLLVVQFAHITDWTGEPRDPEWLFNDMATAPEDFPRIAAEISEEIGRNAVFANKTGLEPEGVFTGGSCVVDASGEIVARAGFGGDVLYADFQLDQEGDLIPDARPIPFQPPKERQ